MLELKINERYNLSQNEKLEILSFNSTSQALINIRDLLDDTFNVQ